MTPGDCHGSSLAWPGLALPCLAFLSFCQVVLTFETEALYIALAVLNFGLKLRNLSSTRIKCMVHRPGPSFETMDWV
jgi:hypothetical protein